MWAEDKLIVEVTVVEFTKPLSWDFYMDDYMETGLFAIVCDPRSSAIVCDHMETSH